MINYKYYVGHLGDHRTGFIKATSQEKAIEILGTSRSDFKAYWQSIYFNEDPEWFDPDTLYTKPIWSTNLWVKGRCEL